MKRIMRKVFGVFLIFGPLFGMLVWSCHWNLMVAIEGLGLLVGIVGGAAALVAVMMYGFHLLMEKK